MDVVIALAYMALGCLLGAVGQGARAIVGLKKEHDVFVHSKREESKKEEKKREV